jgi:transcriptional regulator with XRE-family HTH domain
VTVRTFARWESGDTLGFMRELPHIAQVLGTTLDVLMGTAPVRQRDTRLEDQVEALADEMRQLRQLLMDPAKLRAAADAMEGEEDDPAV